MKVLQIGTLGNLEEVNGLSVSTGATDANKIVETGANGRLDVTLMPLGFQIEAVSIPASENLAAGDFVNTFDDSGTLRVRKADRTNNRPAKGFVIASVTAPANATVYYGNIITGLSGLTIGADYFLNTAGGISATPPAAGSGHLLQKIGTAISATQLLVTLQELVITRTA